MEIMGSANTVFRGIHTKTLANALLERESLDADEVDLIIRGEELPRPEPVRKTETTAKGPQSAGEADGVDDTAPPEEGKPKAVKPREEPAMSLKGQEEPSS